MALGVLQSASSASAAAPGANVLPALRMWDMALLLTPDQFQLRAPDVLARSSGARTLVPAPPSRLETFFAGIELMESEPEGDALSAPLVLLQLQPSIAQRGISLRCELRF